MLFWETRPKKRHAAIRRSIVHDIHLHVDARAREKQGAEALFEEIANVVVDDDDGEFHPFAFKILVDEFTSKRVDETSHFYITV